VEVRAKKAAHSSKVGNGARITVTFALAGTRNRTTTLMEISLKIRVLLHSVSPRTMIIRLLVASPAPKGIQTVAPATHVRGLRFFHPTTSFALLDAQMVLPNLTVMV
jgi:hypothetical protein